MYRKRINTKRGSGRRRFRRRRQAPRSIGSTALARPFPDRYRFNLRYVQYNQLDPGVTSFAYNTFMVNSLYDPDVSGTGHQPMGFDQLTPLYNRYIVTGAKITTSFENSATTVNAGVTVGITVHEGQTFYASTAQDVETLIEQGKTTYRMLSQAQGNIGTVTLSRNISFRKEFAVQDLIGNIEQYGALVTASPANGLFASVWAQASNYGQDPPYAACITKIEFTGYFLEPKLLGGS